MMATHELVVPRSIPITSPASADDDCHRLPSRRCEEERAAGSRDGDGDDDAW
jgi:hypothetical protein